MKQFFLSMILSLIIVAAMAQMPKAINYQAVARNAQGQALANQNIKVRLSIISSAAGNPALYSETRNVTTNALGLFNVQIGSAGAVTTTGDFSAIGWLNNTSATKSLKVELDVNNSGSFTDMGSQSLVTVPYAFAADEAVNAINIGGHYVDTNTPNVGDVLKWDGSAWVHQRPARVYSLDKPVNVVNGGSLAFAWAAQPIQITVYEGDIITLVASATLGTSSGTATQVGINPTYQASGGSITAFAPGNYLTVAALDKRDIYTVSGTLKVVPAGTTPQYGEITPGTYNFGMGIRNTSATAVNNSDAINGFVMVQ